MDFDPRQQNERIIYGMTKPMPIGASDSEIQLAHPGEKADHSQNVRPAHMDFSRVCIWDLHRDIDSAS